MYRLAAVDEVRSYKAVVRALICAVGCALDRGDGAVSDVIAKDAVAIDLIEGNAYLSDPIAIDVVARNGKARGFASCRSGVSNSDTGVLIILDVAP